MQRDRVGILNQRKQRPAHGVRRGDVGVPDGKVENILPPDFLRAGVPIFKYLTDGRAFFSQPDQVLVQHTVVPLFLLLSFFSIAHF